MSDFLKVNAPKDAEAVYINTSTILSVRISKVISGKYGVFIYVHGASYMYGKEHETLREAENAAGRLIFRIMEGTCFEVTD